MVYGIVSFVVLSVYDLAALRGAGVWKHLIGVISIVLLAFGFVRIATSGQTLGLPWAARIGGIAACVVFGALLIYSLFGELSLSETYTNPDTPQYLVTTGTYAMCRHPGVLWFIGGLAGFAVAVDSTAALAALPLWGGLDIAYAVLQDRYYFPKIFGHAYREYQRSVPFLVPTRRSLHRCLRTMGRSHGRGATDGKRD